MSEAVLRCLLVLLGLIHLLPLLGVLGSERLGQLYGLQVTEPNLLLLLRHRAILFGLLGALCVAAAWRPAWQGLALAGAWASVLGFVLLARGAGMNAALQRVWWVDVGALLALMLASMLWARPAI